MNDNDYHREVIAGISSIKKMQTELAKTAEKQIELLERLVEVEHVANDFKSALARMYTRLDKAEEEINKWKVMRQVITWIGPAGSITILWALYELHNLIPSP